MFSSDGSNWAKHSLVSQQRAPTPKREQRETLPRRLPVCLCVLKELKNEVRSNKALLDSLNDVSCALLDLVPWRAREGLEKMVAEDNERYRLVSDTITQKVEEINAAILRSQQVGPVPCCLRAPSSCPGSLPESTRVCCSIPTPIALLLKRTWGLR